MPDPEVGTRIAKQTVESSVRPSALGYKHRHVFQSLSVGAGCKIPASDTTGQLNRFAVSNRLIKKRRSGSTYSRLFMLSVICSADAGLGR